MRSICPLIVVAILLVSGISHAEEWTLTSATEPPPNSPDEPLAESFSMAAAVDFLDRASLDWTKRRACFTCHTNYSYLLARPQVSPAATAHRQVRAKLEELVEVRWQEKGPRWDAEVVMSAAVLAFNDAATSRSLQAPTRVALDRMWSVQRGDGGFDWLKCNWPPMESDDHFGATMAAIAVGVAPDGYRKTPAATAGLDNLQTYFANHPPETLHQTGMLIWADSYLDGLIRPEARDAGIEQLLALQNPDGGWALASLGQWQRSDHTPQDVKSSDGYATGFVIYVLRRGGLAADDARLQNGVSWLKKNQRQSGRWFTRSLNKDNKHFISHAGTAFAVLALASCAGDR